MLLASAWPLLLFSLLWQTPQSYGDGEVRLAGGETSFEGRVEVFFNGQWGTVCDDDWSRQNALVVCRQLGLPTAYPVAVQEFGGGTGPILLDEVQCTGAEESLTDCPHDGIGNHDCVHSEDAGVRCLAGPECNDTDIRLVDGSSPNEGRVEYCSEGVWGTVCDDRWARNNALVVCRQLGLPTENLVAVQEFGKGTGPIVLDEVQCTGTEESLSECPHDGIGNHDCVHSEDAGVRCLSGPECNDTDIRLVGGSSSNEGRVEYCGEGLWGTVCDDGWDSNNALVVCRQLGLPTENTFEIHEYGGGTGLILLDQVDCTGNESSLSECPHAGIVVHDCTHSEDVGVRCEPACNDTDIRLVDGSSPNEGRVEYCSEGKWGTVCGDMWDRSTAMVVCRQLGKPVITVLVSPQRGRGSRSILLENVTCTGNENSLSECSRAVPGDQDSCGFYGGIYVLCVTEQECNDTDIRLVGGSSPSQGRVEYCSEGLWGTVCDDGWKENNALVVCRQLGLPTGYVLTLREFGGGTGPILLDDVECTGDESHLSQCVHAGIGNHDCAHYEDVGVRCEEACFDTDIRLVGSFSLNEGRVEYCSEGVWGTVCDDLWDRNNTLVVCRQLGLPTENSMTFNGYGGGTGLILLDDVQCVGDESRLSQCHHARAGIHDCVHGEDVGVRCGIRLVGSSTPNEGRVELCYEEVWGTVCDTKWDRNNALVACRQLGLPTDNPLVIQQFGGGTGSILLDDVDCTGNESSLWNCSHAGKEVHDCIHRDDVGVRCDPKCNDTDIRLVGGSTPNVGRVEYCNEGVWGTVCSDMWDEKNALVVCRQLGLPTEVIEVFEKFGRGTGPILLDDVACIGNESSLALCTHAGVENHNCFHHEDVGVRCDECQAGALRLQDGTAPSNGRVEVCYNGMWASVCSSQWSDTDTSVVCRQLGYDSQDGMATYVFGPGQGRPVVFSEVQCSGEEDKLTDCFSTSSYQQSYTCENSPGVTCDGPVKRCADEKEISPFAQSNTDKFGACEPYRGGVEMCNDILSADVDFVFISKSHGSQENISQFLESNVPHHLLADDYCREQVYRIICNYYLIPCGNDGSELPPSSICPEECFMVESTCPLVWEALKLRLSNYRFINCNDTSALLFPLSNCCTGVGIEQRITENESKTSFNMSTAVVGAVAGFLVLIVFVVVVMLLGLLYQRWRRKKRLTNWQMDIMEIPNRAPSSANATCKINGPHGTELQAYVVHGADVEPDHPTPVHEASNRQLLGKIFQPVSAKPSYMRLMTQDMIITHEQITLLQNIGQGEFGIVYKATLAVMNEQMNSNMVVAVKTLHGYFNQTEIENIMKESLKMKNFSHPHVMSLIGLCLNAGPAPYIVMPYMANGSLLHYLKRERSNLVLKDDADEDETREVSKHLAVMCTQIADGMEYLAKERFVHRDLAARNCMIDSNFVIKISDFGLSEDVYAKNYFRQGSSDEVVKLPVKWMAPESLIDGHFSEKSDVWSYGVTMWEIFSGGKAPYPGIDPLTLMQLLEAGRRMNKPINAACSDEMFELMIKCWEYEPGNRPSFQELHKSTSRYIKRIAGYLQMSFYTTKGKETNITEKIEDREKEENITDSEPERFVQMFPPYQNL